MENRKLGAVLVVISLAIGSMLVYYSSSLSAQGQEAGCFPSEECAQIEKALNFTHVAVGVFAFLLALGFYLLLFNKTEERIMGRLEKEKEDEKFDFALRFLDPYERKVIRIVKEQDGITQNTLRIRSDMSKAKLSYVLQDLEKRGLVKRVKKGKTLSVYLKI